MQKKASFACKAQYLVNHYSMMTKPESTASSHAQIGFRNWYARTSSGDNLLFGVFVSFIFRYFKCLSCRYSLRNCLIFRFDVGLRRKTLEVSVCLFGYESLYKVSNLGRVKALQKITQENNRSGCRNKYNRITTSIFASWS